MCRNIKTLYNFEPPATDDEIRASALQFVRKLSGSSKPSRVNEAAFNQAVDDVTAAAERLVRPKQIAQAILLLWTSSALGLSAGLLEAQRTAASWDVVTVLVLVMVV